MSGLLEEYGLEIPADELPEGSDFDIPDGPYEFEIGDYFLKEYEDKVTKNPRSALIITFLLGDDGKSKGDFYALPADKGNPTPKELGTVGRLRDRLVELGIPREGYSKAAREDLVGITGTCTVKHDKTGKWQNIVNIKVGSTGPVASAPTSAPGAKAPTGRKPVAKTAVDNPFAKKEAE